MRTAVEQTQQIALVIYATVAAVMAQMGQEMPDVNSPEAEKYRNELRLRVVEVRDGVVKAPGDRVRKYIDEVEVGNGRELKAFVEAGGALDSFVPWHYGRKYDADKRTDPKLLPWDERAAAERIEDAIVVATAKELLGEYWF